MSWKEVSDEMEKIEKIVGEMEKEEDNGNGNKDSNGSKDSNVAKVSIFTNHTFEGVHKKLDPMRMK